MNLYQISASRAPDLVVVEESHKKICSNGARGGVRSGGWRGGCPAFSSQAKHDLLLDNFLTKTLLKRMEND